MKCLITLDRYDGTQSKSIVVDDLGGISMSSMVFKLMQADICGFTVTKVIPAEKAVEKMRGKSGP